MISSLFGVAAAKVNSISETIQSLNPTETLENALKTAPPVSVPSSFPTPQSFNTTSQPTRAPQPTFTKPSQPSAQVAPPRNQPPIGLSNSRSSAALSNNSNFPPEESKNNQVYFSPQHTSSSSAASRNESKEAPPLPDLSGLSAEEQRKIREVLERQCDEDASEQQALTRQRGELEQLEKDVRLLGEQSRSMGMADGSVCQICFQVKFEPVSSSTPAGHRCHSCQLKFCASCGHKTQLHTHKLAWQCKICKKKADILARSGKWVSPATVNKSEQSAAPQNNATVGVNNAAGATDHSSSFSQGQGQPAHPAVSSCTASSNGPLTGGPQSNEQLKPQPGQPEVVNHRQNDPRSGHGDLIGQHNNSSGLSNQQQYNNLNSNNVNAFSSKPQQLQPGSQQQHHQQVSNNITQAHPIAAPTQTTSAAAAANSNSSSSSPFSQLAKLLPAAIQPAVLSQQASSAPHPQTSNSNPVSANSSNTRLPGPPDSNNVSAAGLLGGSGAGLLSSMGVGENAQPPPPLPPPRSSNPPHPLKGGSAAAVAGQQPPPPRRSITSSSFSHSRTGSARSSRGISNSSGNLAPPRRSPPRPPEDGGPPYSSSHGHAPHHRRSPSGRYSLGGGSAPRDPDLPDSGYRSESNRTSSSRDSLEKQRRQREHLGGREPSSQQPHQQQHHSGDKRHSAGSMHKMDSIGSEFSVPNDSGVPMYKTSAGSLHYSDLGQHPDDALAGGVGHHSYHDDPYAREAPRDHHPRDQNHLGAGAPCRTTSRHRSPPTHPRGGLDLLGAGGGRSFSSSEEDIRSTSDLTSWDGFESESLISDRGGGAGFDPWDDFNLGYSSASSRSWRGGAVEWSANADGFGSLIGRITMNKGVGRELGLKVRGGQPLDTILASCGHGLSSSLATAAASVPDKVDLEALSQQYAGVLAALVVNVRRGSPADVTAGLVAGDEILEWNKVSFRNLTHNQVTHVIMQSKQETEVELVICRRPFLQLKQLQLNSGASRGSRSVSGSATAAPVSGSSVTAAGAQLVDQVHNNSAVAAASQLPYPPRPTTRRGPTQHPSNSSGGHSDPTGVHSSVTSSAAVGVGGGSGDVMNGGAGGGSSSSNANISSSSAASALFYSLPASVYRNISAAPPPTGHFSSTGGQGHPHMQPSSECVSGQLQMQLSYNDKDSQLTVTVCQAVDLISREGGQARNPYAKIYLLPDRSEDSLRRTKTATNTLCPQWNQSFSFYVNRNSFPDKELEVTLWDNCFADQPPPPVPVTSSAAATDHFLYKGGALAVKEFLGEVLLSLDQAMLDNDLSPSSGPQWYDLHVHDSSSNHSLPIPSPPPPSMSHQQNPLSLAPPHSTARQKSAPAYDTSATAAHTSYGTSSSKFPLNSLWPNNAVDDSIEVADKTSSWDNNSNPVASSVGTGGGVDARMAAQALLSPQSLDRSHGGREDVFLSRKGATAPSTPMRSEMGAADYQRMNNRVSLDNSGYLSGSMDQRGPGGGGRRAHSQRDTPEFASFGGGGGARHSRGTGAGNYELWDEHRSPRSNRYTSGYHSAGEGYHYVTGGSSRHSDVGDDRDDLLLYATDIEGPSAGGRHRHSRSAFDNWENRSTSRYSSRSPTYYSDVEAATGRRVLRHPGGRDQFSGGPTDHGYRSGGHGGRQHRASSSSAGRRGSGSSDHFLDQDGSFPRSLPDPRSGRGNGGAVASSRFYGGNNNRNLSSSFNVGGGATGAAGLHQSGGEVFRFRRYRGGPASRVRQYNRHGGNTHNNSILSQSAGGGGANFWSPQNLKSHATAHFTRDRMCHSDAEGDFLSDYEFERGAGSTGHGGRSLVHPFSSSNYSYRHGGTSPGSTGPSTPTQSFGFPGGGGMGIGGSGRAGGGGGGGGEEQSEHSITPRAGMFSPNEYVNDRNIPMRRQSSVQNPPVSPPPPMGRSSHGGGGEESSSSRSLRRQISDALGGYFGGGGSSDNNLQHSERGGAAADKMDDFLHTHNDLTSPHLRNQNYDRGRKQLDGGGGGEREYSRSSGGGGGGGEKLSRESCHSSGRFGGGDDCSSFDSPGSRSRSNTNKTNNSSNLYSPSSEYANENMPPPRTGKRSRESSGLNERSPRCSEQQQEQYMDNEHSHSHSSSRDRERGGGDYVQQPPPRHSSGRGSKAPPELEPPEMYDDGGSGSMDEHQNHQGRGGRSWEREYHENDMGDTTSNVSNAQHPSRGAHPGDHLPSRGAEGERGDRDSRGGASQQGRSHREGERQEEEEEEEEDDIELAFRRGGLESEADLRDELDEDEEDDIDNWLLAQSKKYGVKMEQVDRSEEAEHVLSASMPMGADAGFFSDSGGVGGFPGPHGAGGGVGGKKRRPSIGHKIGALVGLSKKSNSLTQLQDTRNKRISIPRSAEVGFHTHDDMKQYLLSRMTADTESIATTEASLFLQSQYAMPAEKQLNSFVEDLGPGQVVGRQVLGSPCLGEIQLSIGLKRNTCLEVEIVRARNLTMRPQAKLFPAAFVKVYLMEGKKCCGKAKTKIARRTTDPYFQQQLSFDAAPSGRALQVTVWGDYGRMERKCFMGVAQINLDALNLSNIVIGWYKLFTSSSLVEHSKNSSCSHAPGFAPSHFSDY